MAYNKVKSVQHELCDVISSSPAINVSLIVRDYRSKVGKELNDISNKHDYDFCIDDDDDDQWRNQTNKLWGAKCDNPSIS
ncbi:hypothetical protein Tco_0854027, partial [Tanacetum coccineum]